ncbi:MAG: methyltransferase domain-containing protein [Eubacteriales bacterium]|nr:methyltransferase domain-containing protein [Eubacteriales bacterium]
MNDTEMENQEIEYCGGENEYTTFAEVYDIFMEDTPYREWAAYIEELIGRYGISRPEKARSLPRPDESTPVMPLAAHAEQFSAAEQEKRAAAQEGQEQTGTESAARHPLEESLRTERNLVVDLGCGTGKMTEILASAGYDMIGIDSSADMLALAMKRRDAAFRDTLYLEQDMRDFELYGTAGTFVSVCDCVNYLLTPEDLVRMFRQVNLYLYPQGIFIFDFNTVYKYRDMIGDATIAENREHCSFIWENWFYEKDNINEYDVTIFKEEPESGLFSRSTETHYQRGYTLEEMRAAAEQAGLIWVMAVDGDTHGDVNEKSGRILAVVRENGKMI